MANVFKNYTGTATTGGLTVYTVPASTTSVLIGLNLANKTGGSVTASVQVAGVYVVFNAAIPAGTALSVLDGKIVAETTDTVVVTASANSAVDVIVSAMEQS